MEAVTVTITPSATAQRRHAIDGADDIHGESPTTAGVAWCDTVCVSCEPIESAGDDARYAIAPRCAG